MKHLNILLRVMILFSFSLIASCEKDATKPAPVANFTMNKTEAAIGEEISFTNTSQNATTYSWSFGDGTSSTAEHPTHSYSSSGTYTINLIATGDGGSDSETENISVKLIPKDGVWLGQYKGNDTPGVYDIGFFIKNGKITKSGSIIRIDDVTVSMFTYVYYSNVTITFYNYSDVEVNNGSFDYISGQVTSGSGQLVVTGTFISPTICSGTVSHEVNSSMGQGANSFDFTASFIDNKSVKNIQIEGKKEDIISRNNSFKLIKTQNKMDGLNALNEKK
jgi:PKD repeat protein